LTDRHHPSADTHRLVRAPKLNRGTTALAHGALALAHGALLQRGNMWNVIIV
jgi:hypothetical protein